MLVPFENGHTAGKLQMSSSPEDLGVLQSCLLGSPLMWRMGDRVAKVGCGTV